LLSRPARTVLAAACASALALAPSLANAQTPPPAAPPPAAPPGYAPPPAGYAPPPAGYAPPPAGYAPPPAGYAPPGAYGPPPGAYGPPPGAYGPPPGYYAPPGAYQGPRVIDDWEEGQPIPPGYHPKTKIRAGLVGAGAGVLGGFWLATALPSVVVADATGNGAAALGAIPIAGPFALIPQSGGFASLDFLFVLDGLAQVAGAAMLIAGIAAPKTVLVRNDVGKVTILPKPMTFGKTGAGFGLQGTY
jgi:hypothetical protein